MYIKIFELSLKHKKCYVFLKGQWNFLLAKYVSYFSFKHNYSNEIIVIMYVKKSDFWVRKNNTNLKKQSEASEFLFQ